MNLLTNRDLFRKLLAGGLLLMAIPTSIQAQSLPVQPPSALGFDEQRLRRIEDLVMRNIEAENLPGCVICFGRRESIAYLRAFGNRQIEPEKVGMTVDTVFDLASLTKPVATGTCIMKLLEQGHFRLGSRVVEFFPEFGVHGKDQITIQDLLLHQSGLIPDNPLADYSEGPETAWRKICELQLVDPVGTTFKYSDVNFIVLAKLVEKVSGVNLHQFSQQQVFQPLGMSETGFLPAETLRLRCAPTEQRDGEWMRGQVHDPRAYQLGGIAGHAGLFSSASDLARYSMMMLGRRERLTDNRSTTEVLSQRSVNLMTRGYQVSGGARGLSWDRRTEYSSNRGDLLSEYAFGHGGFTGTVIWIDPELDLFFVFLSNRLHPAGKGQVNSLAGQIANVIVGAMKPGSESSVSIRRMNTEVLTGLDVLERDQFRRLAGRRIGLITNQTGRNAQGVGTVKVLHDSPLIDLRVLFSPEHGFEGLQDLPRIEDATDRETGLTIHSLYGTTRRPTAKMCESIDTLVFDIQDIGTRFYTYSSTLGECMIAASQLNKRFVVLDRPNPIGGSQVAGPILDPGRESFVAFHRLPIRHGLTMGEMAQLLKTELGLNLDLEVVKCEGWTRNQLYDSTGLLWVNPSPNMRSLTQALLYPGVGLLETTNLSVGRGTDTPFEVVGAPWIRGREFAAELKSLQLDGVSLTPIEFTPESSKFAGQLCQGVRIAITDRNRFEPLSLGFALATSLRKMYPNDWEIASYNDLLLNQSCFEAVANGKPLEQVLAESRSGVADYLRRREAVLLYR